MEITFAKYKEEYRYVWDQFIEGSINGNFLHKRTFYDANPLNIKDDQSFLVYKNNKLIALIPGVLIKDSNGITFYSHRRSTYGGIIVGNRVGVEEALLIVEKFLEALSEKSVNHVVLTNPFKIFYKQISDEVEYALWYHGFELKDRMVEIYVDLREDLLKIKHKYDNGTKYNIKKALKHVEIKIGKILEFADFWIILETNLQQRHGKKPVHTIEEILLLIEKVGEENIKLFGAYLEGKLIAGCIVFLFHDSIHAQYIGQDDEYQEYRAVSAIMDYIIEWGNCHGYFYFNLGTANDGGRTINKGLFHFKESFGGRGVLRETYYLKLS